jgi:hypothetical protein
VYVSDEKTIADIIAWLASSIGGAVWADGSTFKVMWVYAPTGSGPVYDIDDILTSGFAVQMGVAPDKEGGGLLVKKVTIRGGKNWHPVNTGELAAAVLGTTVETNFKLPFLNIGESTDAFTELFNPLAASIEFESAIRFTTQDESDRLLLLYKVRRDRLTLPLSFADDISKGDVDIGTEVQVNLQMSGPLSTGRLGMGSFLAPDGKPFLVIGRKDDYKTKTRTLILWG